MTQKELQQLASQLKTTEVKAIEHLSLLTAILVAGRYGESIQKCVTGAKEIIRQSSLQYPLKPETPGEMSDHLISTIEKSKT